MIELIGNIVSTSLIITIVSYVINGACMPKDTADMSDKQAVIVGLTFLLPLAIFIISLITLIWIN